MRRCPTVGAIVTADDFGWADLPEWGGPGTPSAWLTPPAAPLHRRLRIKDGFTVVDSQQRRLHDRAQALGFVDLRSYLAARCGDDASLTQLASELHTTRDVIRRRIDQAGIQRSSPKVRSARQRRHRLSTCAVPLAPAYSIR